MASFPLLRTSAVAQYPLTCKSSFSTEILQFVDGSEQRYRNYGRPIRRWAVQLNQLDEGEVAALRQFFREQAGVTGRFSFTDPITETAYANCSFDQPVLTGELREVQCGAATLIIRTNESS